MPLRRVMCRGTHVGLPSSGGSSLMAPELPARTLAAARHLEHVSRSRPRDHGTEPTMINQMVLECEAEWILVQRVAEQAIKIRKEDQSKRA
jgi:hypothetical protein